jgi:hypothetical protein
VIGAWAESCRAAGEALPVLSLDFHTDVLNCVSRGVESPVDVERAVEILHHDEHFDWSLRAGIISRAVIIALSPCAVEPEHPALEVRRSRLLPDMDVMLNDSASFRPAAEMVLDDRFLEPLLADGFPRGRYILDIDCDYILCRKALSPEKDSLLRSLMNGAETVTFSREDDWIKILKLPGENICGSDIVAALSAFCR